MNITRRLSQSALAIALVGTAVYAQAEGPALNTVNPDGLTFDNVQVPRPKFDEPFARTGTRVPVQQIAKVVAGATGEQVQGWLGAPIAKTDAKQGQLWDYNLELRMDDGNFIVCQYKVVFAPDAVTVRETTWRRQQCADTFAANLKDATKFSK